MIFIISMFPVQLLSRFEPLPEPLAVTAERPVIPVPAEILLVEKHLGIGALSVRAAESKMFKARAVA